MSDLISRADAIEAIMKHKIPFTIQQEMAREINALPSTELPKGELISRADAINAFWEDSDIRTAEVRATLKALPSADTEPKWNCTANFVAEQLDRLRKMTDEEKWEFFKRFFEMKGGAE